MPDNEKITMWNGGDTNKYDRMIRESEDYLDGVDVETNEEFNPTERINKDMDKPTKITGMGGKGGPVQAIKSRNKK